MLSCETEKRCEGFAGKHDSTLPLPGRQHSLIWVTERKWCKWQNDMFSYLSGFSLSDLLKVIVIPIFSCFLRKSERGRRDTQKFRAGISHLFCSRESWEKVHMWRQWRNECIHLCGSEFGQMRKSMALLSVTARKRGDQWRRGIAPGGQEHTSSPSISESVRLEWPAAQSAVHRAGLESWSNAPGKPS